MKRNSFARHRMNFPRAGTTLSEVLVALLVMAVGVVSLITLFPISVLRSAQAAHLTNAANLRYNVEALLGARPELYSISRGWVASGSYAVNDFVIPTELTAVKAPPVVFRCTQAGTSGAVEPNWDFQNGNTTNDNGVRWVTFRLRNYVIDPLGEVLMSATPSDYAYRNTNNGDFFGNYGGNPVQGSAQMPGMVGVRAFAGGVTTEPAADDLGASPDNWTPEVESRAVTLNSLGDCTLTDLQDLITPISAGFPSARIILFDITGKISHTRQIDSTSASGLAQNITWNKPLPSGFTPATAKVDLKSRRYTWMLSVRRSFGGASLMDVVIFFKRPFSPKDEELYPASFQTGAIDTRYSNAANDYWANFVIDPGYDGLPGVAGYDDDGFNGVDDAGELGFPGSDDAPRNWVVIQYDASGDKEKPFVKKGGYVTDGENLRWYRILDYYEAATPELAMRSAGIDTTVTAYTPDAPLSGNHRSIFIRVENKILQNGTQPSGGAGGTPRGRAMLMRGIVDVYPIRTHQTWDN